jgi:RNA polymerase sigma-70 factor (ECF subfamily)
MRCAPAAGTENRSKNWVAREKNLPSRHHIEGSNEELMPLPPDILGRLYRQHAPALRLYARQWVAAAEDCVHDAFVQLAQQEPPPNRVLPWLYRTARNAAYMAQRSAWRRRRREDALRRDETWFSRVDEQLDADEATRLLSDLPLDEREIIVARIWGGLTFDEIAHMVDCTLPTAHRRYQTALANLKQRLEGHVRLRPE